MLEQTGEQSSHLERTGAEAWLAAVIQRRGGWAGAPTTKRARGNWRRCLT